MYNITSNKIYEALLNIREEKSHAASNLTYLLRPVVPPGTSAVNKSPPGRTILSQCLQLSPRKAHLPHLCLYISPPTVPWPSSLPHSLWVPRKRLPCDVWFGLSDLSTSIVSGGFLFLLICSLP